MATVLAPALENVFKLDGIDARAAINLPHLV
jgi:hypothetical protein